MSASCLTWHPAPAKPTPEGGEVHVWLACLDRRPSLIERLSRTLAPDERARAGRFYFQKDREHFIIARGVLRDILGRYLDVSPGRLRFGYNSYGKPALNGEHAGGALRFNLSHSHGLALYAVTSGREVGVDLERVRADLADESIAEHYFSPPEVAALRALPPHLRVEAFFNCWTRKEAYIKARGEGLSLPLDRFAVSATPGEPARLLSVEGAPQEVSRWSLRELSCAPGYVGALAAEAGGWLLKCWRWSDEAGGAGHEVE